MLSAIGVPNRLGMGPDAVSAIGGGIVAAVAITRWVIRNMRKAPTDWRDVLGTIVGVFAAVLGVSDLVGHSEALDGIDPDLFAMLGSGLATAFAAHRADLIVKPPAPPTNGLLLLVFGSFSIACTIARAPAHLEGDEVCRKILVIAASHKASWVVARRCYRVRPPLHTEGVAA